MFVASRMIIFSLALLSRDVIYPGPYFKEGGLMAILTQWDAGWYLSIARDGYFFVEGSESSAVFFPFYPLVVRAVGYAFGDLAITGVLLSNVALVGAAIVLQELIRIDYADGRVGRTAIVFLMFSPVSFFFSSVHTESTFLLLAAGAFLAARKERWLLAAVCGAALSATRNVGVLVLLPLLAEFVQQRRPSESGRRTVFQPQVLWLALVPLGLAAFFLFCYFQWGDPLANLKAAAQWGRTLAPPWQTLANAFGLPVFYRWLFLLLLLTAMVVFGVGVWLRVRLSYLIYAGSCIAIYLCSNSLESVPRYLSIVFPLFITLGLVVTRFPRSYEPLLAGSCALLTLCTALWANGYWMT